MVHTQSVRTYLISNFSGYLQDFWNQTSGYIYLKVDTIEITL